MKSASHIIVLILAFPQMFDEIMFRSGGLTYESSIQTFLKIVFDLQTIL